MYHLHRSPLQELHLLKLYNVMRYVPAKRGNEMIWGTMSEGTACERKKADSIVSKIQCCHQITNISFVTCMQEQQCFTFCTNFFLNQRFTYFHLFSICSQVISNIYNIIYVIMLLKSLAQFETPILITCSKLQRNFRLCTVIDFLDTTYLAST